MILPYSPDLNLTPLVAFLRFCRAQRGSDRNLPLFVRWEWHKNVSHPNYSMSATILSTCYASTESLGVSELNDTNIKSFGIPGRISRAVESTNFTTNVFTLPHIMAPKFANQLPIRNVGRTCNGSGNVWSSESRLRCTGTLENTAPHKIRCDIFFLFYSVEMLSVQFASKPPRETLMSGENQRIKAFGFPTWEFAFPISEIAMQMKLITWQNLTSKVKPK